MSTYVTTPIVTPPTAAPIPIGTAANPPVPNIKSPVITAPAPTPIPPKILRI